MAWTTDCVRKLVDQLDSSLERGSGGELTPEAVDVALTVIRAHRRELVAPAETPEGFQVEAIDDLNMPGEVLAITPDENIAHAALAQAKRRFPARNIVLRGRRLARAR
jgi:hypothetical protein